MTNEFAIALLKQDIQNSKINISYRHNEVGIKALELAIKALEQQQSEDCISVTRLLEHLENITMDTNPDHYEDKDKWYQANGFNLCKVGIEMFIKNLPSVTPQPKVGKWIRRPDRASDIEYRCSECGKIQFADDTNELNYCCNCGSKMEVSE